MGFINSTIDGINNIQFNNFPSSKVIKMEKVVEYCDGSCWCWK